jgi:undecaprenyl-diphosphatase
MTSNRSTLLRVLPALALALLWLAAFLLGTGDVDLAILRLLYAGDRPMLADAARLITFLGGGYFVTPLAAVVALVVALRGRVWLGLVLFVGTSAGRLLVEYQKYELGRLRPDEHPHLVNVYNLSFPSGHSANAAMVYVTLALTLAGSGRRTPWLVAAFALAFLIGLSRMMLGVHWPSDVVAGWSFGLLWAMLLVWLSEHPPAWAVRR